MISEGQYASESDHPSIAFAYPINKLLFGYGTLLAGYAVSIFSVWNGFRGRLWGCAASFAVAVFLAFHGLSTLLG